MKQGFLADYEKVLEHLKEEEVVQLVSKLVEIESHKDAPTKEKEVAQYIAEVFKANEIKGELDEIFPNRPNVYGFIGKKAGKSIMLNGHLDTVPALDMEDAFTPKLIDGKLIGRGAVDMKGAIGAMMLALICIQRSRISLNGQAIFTGVIDEELRADGAAKMMEKGYPLADVAIVGEPTNLSIKYGHKGMEWVEVTVIGKSGHGSLPDTGLNAIHFATDLVIKLREKLLPKLKERTHPILGEPTINIGNIKGGEDPNVIPVRCKIQIDRRWVPEESLESMQNDIKELIAEVKKENEGFQVTIRRMTESVGTHYPLYTNPDHPFVHELQEAIKYELGTTPKHGVFEAWSDGAQLSHGGITSLVCGPGDIGVAHSQNEYIKISEIMQAARIYIYTIMKYLA